VGAGARPVPDSPAGHVRAGAAMFPTTGGLVKRVVLSLSVFAAVLAAVAGTVSIARANPVRDDIDQYRHVTWKWQRLMGRSRMPTYHHERVAGESYRLWIRNLWRRRATRAWRLAQNPPHEPAWRCIHRYEGAWNDEGSPYYGGLQMDISFQRAYGSDLLRRKGTADNWTPLEQMWVAERAWRAGRGFYPWPNTARACGLL
jgi:hypothetical protein